MEEKKIYFLLLHFEHIDGHENDGKAKRARGFGKKCRMI